MIYKDYNTTFGGIEMRDFPKVSEGIFDAAKTNAELFLELVGQYFPEAVKDGEVDFTALKEEMGEFETVSAEHYDFTWAGKQAAKKEAQADAIGRTLRFKPQDSVNAGTTENIYIEGDNLEALKLIRKSYYGRIKMIYIDPPYNTGTDFVYHDNFTMTEQELAKLSGDTSQNERMRKNTVDSAKYHTNWLNMMYPRLKIAKDLLSDDGVIFISLDDNEVDNLKKICDEIFGAHNFICTFVRKNKAGSGHDSRKIAIEFDYVLCYAKSVSENNINQEAVDVKNDAKYKYSDEFVAVRGKYYLRDLDYKGSYSEKLDYPIVMPDGKTIYSGGKFGKPNTWRWSKEKFEWGLKNGYIVFQQQDGKSKVYIKQYQYVDNNGELYVRSIPYRALIDYSNGQGTLDFNNIMETNAFSYPKPVGFLKHLLNIASNSDSIILDFFSGSATTAHAVMQLNAEDGGNRRFIMVQLPEETDEKSEAYKAGYKNICEIGKERIRRAAQKIHEDNPDVVFDDGFLCFETADTNIRWNKMTDDDILTLDNYLNEKDKVDFVDGFTDTDVVYEIMLRQYGVPLSTKIEQMSEISDRTYIFNDAVVVCLEGEITDELIEKLSDIEPIPAKFILRDSAFGDDIKLKETAYRKLTALIGNHQTDEEKRSKYNTYTVEFI